MKHQFQKVKIITMIVLSALSSILFSACSKCDGEQPRARIVNNGTKDASAQIKTSGGNTININNIPVGAASAFNSFAAGATTFTITVDKLNYVQSFQMADCFEYDILIDANNNITSTPKDRNE